MSHSTYNQSINQSNQIYIAPCVASESEARDGGARRSVHVHCNQCQTVLSLKSLENTEKFSGSTVV